VCSGPFEPFALIHIAPYAAGIQHSGHAIIDHLKPSFAIIRFNSRTYESGGVVAVVKAHAAAEHLLRDYEFGQSDQDRHNGWRYFLFRGWTRMRPPNSGKPGLSAGNQNPE
jgi:hypothetical protein